MINCRRKLVIIADLSLYGGINSFLLSYLEYCRINKFHVIILTTHTLPAPIDCVIKNSTFQHIVIKFKCCRFSQYLPILYPLERLVLDYISVFPLLHRIQPTNVIISSSKPGNWWGLFCLPFPIQYFLHTVPEHNICFLYRFVSSIFIRHKKIIVTVSNFSKKNITNHIFLSAHKNNSIHVVHNTVFSNMAKKITHQSINILTVGHLEQYKNPFLWAKVASKVIAKYPNVHFYWVGDGSLRQDVLKYVKSLGTHNIHLCGYSDNVSKYYSIADIYFQPSKIESHGIAVLEAMMYSLPCVISNAGGLPESIISNVSGYIISRNSLNDYIEALTKLVMNGQLRQKLGGNARANYLHSFSFLVWCKKLDLLFRFS